MAEEESSESGIVGGLDAFMGIAPKKSVFRVNVTNQLGLDFQKSRSKLLSVALSSPAEYFRARDDLISSITETQVKLMYEIYWRALTKGMLPKKGRDGYTQFEVGGAAFEPNMPESEVNKFALKVANAVKEIAEEAVEEIMPMQYKDLAVSRSVNKLEADRI